MKKTPLNEIHKELGAKLTDFGGWEMPLKYTSIIKEHQAVRNNCGIFDVSHMGEIVLKGSEAYSVVQKLITNDISKLKNGEVLYTPICSYEGGIIDDILVYQLADNQYMLVVNAGNINKDMEWIKKNIKEKECKILNLSDEYALIAVQGPKSLIILKNLVDINIEIMDKFSSVKTKINNEEVLISKTGYTGELGYEIYLDQKKAKNVWNLIIKKGENHGLAPAGLGARNTLRLEKKLCLYGNDITEKKHPLEAGLGWTVKFDKKEDFIGKKALHTIKNKGYKKILTGFKMKDRRVPRKGYKIEMAGNAIGEVTSGSYSPTLKENIGLGYIDKDYSSIGKEINIMIRGKSYKAKIVDTPFV